jgi:multiple sugar transport system substrate-binding protein
MLKKLLVLILIFSSGCSKEGRKTVVIRLWHGIESPQNNSLLEEKVREFENLNPGIKVELQNIGAQDKAMPKIVTAVSAGAQPELLWYAPAYTGRLAASGKLLSAQDFMEVDKSFNRDDIYDGLLKSGFYDGKIFTVPFEANCLGMYYNKKHFRDAGIEKIPENWEEFMQTAVKLTVDADENGQPERFGFLMPLGTEEWTVWTWQTFLWQAGGDIISRDGKELVFHESPGVNALQFWVDLVHKYKCAVFSARNAGYKIDPFISGKVSMMINGPWNYPVLSEQNEVEYGSFKLPMDERRSTNIGGENLFIFRSNPDKEEASWKFAKFVMSEKFQVDWAIKTGYLPVSRRAAASDGYIDFLESNPFIKTYVDSMEFGMARPAIKNYSRISKRIGHAIEKALYRQMPPREALKEAYENSKDLL